MKKERTKNTKWTYEEKEDHVILRWRDYEILIDHDDFHYFEENIFRIIYNKSIRGPECAYLYICHCTDWKLSKYKYETYHRVIMNCPDDRVVDHKNRNTLDNRKSNLRICTKIQNQWNSKKKIRNESTTSSHKGVSRCVKKWKHKKYYYWVANITFNGKTYKKVFKEELEAARWYDKKAVELFGEFAKINGV